MNILIFGTSITWGAWDEEGGWAERLKLYCIKKAIDEKSNTNYAEVYNLAVDGDNTAGLVKYFETDIKARLSKINKTLIFVEMGINDSQIILKDNSNSIPLDDYKKNLLTLIEKSKKLGAEIIFLGLTPVDKRVDPIPWATHITYRIEVIKKYDEILQEICKDKQIPYIEMLSKFPENEYEKLLADGVHPSTEGHKIMYEEVKKYLTENSLI